MVIGLTLATSTLTNRRETLIKRIESDPLSPSSLKDNFSMTVLNVPKNKRYT